MSIVLVGSTSGSITLQEPAVAGTTVLTLPAVSGTILTTTSPKVGNVIQVVNATYAVETSTTSASYVTTGLSASITPSSSSSKILVLASNMLSAPAGNNSNFTVFRGTTSGTNLTGASGFAGYFTSGSVTGVSASYLDSPATTSAQTYTCAFKCSGGTAAVQAGGGAATLTLIEVAA